MEKITVYGLPLTPRPELEQLAGGSFCVSYATRKDLGRQLDDAIRLVGKDGILLVDNGAFSHFTKGGEMNDEYIAGFEAWALEILARCPQAIAVLPDVIGGTTEQNAELIATTLLPRERAMAIWHLDEPIESLLHRCEDHEWIGFGSSGKYWKPGTPEWKARVAEAFEAIDQWERESDGAYIRPRIHMMRAQAFAHLFPFDSSDSTNVAVNHVRYKNTGAGHIARFAARIDAKIQASAGPAVEHQIKRPLLGHVEIAEAEARIRLQMIADFLEMIDGVPEAELTPATRDRLAMVNEFLSTRPLVREALGISTPAELALAA